MKVESCIVFVYLHKLCCDKIAMLRMPYNHANIKYYLQVSLYL